MQLTRNQWGLLVLSVVLFATFWMAVAALARPIPVVPYSSSNVKKVCNNKCGNDKDCLIRCLSCHESCQGNKTCYDSCLHLSIGPTTTTNAPPLNGKYILKTLNHPTNIIANVHICYTNGEASVVNIHRLFNSLLRDNNIVPIGPLTYRMDNGTVWTLTKDGILEFVDGVITKRLVPEGESC